MSKYSVKRLSELAKVSVRTLHYYDQIGLLKPSFRSEKGYRFYERQELLLLQQILFYKELDFSLEQIKDIIYDPEFDILTALESHKQALQRRSSEIETLLKTIDKTIFELKNENMKVTEEQMYEGFNPDEVESMREEVKERWGVEQLEAVESVILNMSKEGWDDHKAKGEEINQLLAKLMNLDPSSKQVQQAISLHHKHLNFYYEVSEERYLGLADMYVEDERFRSYYENYSEGLAEFIRTAVQVYCENGMKVE